MPIKSFDRGPTRNRNQPPYHTGRYHGADKAHIGYYDLPYGMWTSGAGREVLFNRRYHALWLREPGGPTIRTRVEHFSALFPSETYEEEWFIKSDAESPLIGIRYWRRSEQILMAFVTGRKVRKYLQAGRPGSIENMMKPGHPEDLV